MMRLIISKSIRYRFIVMGLAVALIFFGTRNIQDAPLDVFPEFSPPRVEVQTLALGLSATEVEELVTIPLEDALNGIDGLDVMRSKSVAALSVINLIFERDTDLLLARQMVQERLGTATPTLPTWASPPVIMPPLSSTSRFLKIGMSSDTVSLIDMSMTAYWKIRSRFLQVPGVANVMIYGERLQMYQVQIDPSKLQANNVPLELVLETTGDSLATSLVSFSDGAYIGSGGFIDTPNQRLNIKHVLPIIEPQDLGEITIKDRPNVRLKDVAVLVEGHQPLIGDAIVNDGPGLMLIVEKFPWANTLDVTKGIDEAIRDLQPGLPGVDIDPEIFRPATFIEESLRNLTGSLILGSILVIVILFFFLFEWRTALISVVAIPLSLTAAALILDLRGTTINVMILAGLVIAIGDVVDDAIIDVENIWRRLRQARAQGSTESLGSIILNASVEVRSAIIYATLLALIVLSPVFFLEGLSGAFFRPLAISYTLALLSSMVVALTVTPALSFVLLRNAPLESRASPVVPWLQRTYGSVLARSLRQPRFAYGTVAVLLIAGVLVVPKLGQELLPEFKEHDFLMHWLTKPGTSQPEMARITTLASAEIRSIPGVRNFGAHIGQAFLSDEPYGVYFGENWVSVDSSRDYDKTVSSIQSVIDGYPGLYHDVQTYLKERIREVLTGAKQAVVVRVYGADITVLRESAEKLQSALDGLDGLTSLTVEFQYPIPQVEVEVNLEAAQRYGLKPGDVRRASGILISGEEAGDIFRAGRAYDVQVWSTPETRNSVEDIANLMIDAPFGGPVRLGEVADVRIRPTPNHIDREYQSRKIDVTANVQGRDLGSVSRDVERIVRQVELPLGYRAEVQGEAAERAAASDRLTRYALIAAVGVFALLQVSFRSWRLAILAFVTLPSALIGGVLAAYLHDGVLSLGSLVGFLTVLGISARNGIMMLDHFRHLEEEEGVAFGPGLVLRGAQERIAPILMTALATGFALLPLLAVGNVPGHEIEYPMAIVIMGGILTTTLLNLFVVPSLYLRFAKGFLGPPRSEAAGPPSA